MEDNEEYNEEVLKRLNEIRDVLVGTYEKKGLISRIASLEKYMGIIGGLSLTAITGVIGRAIVLMMS